MPTPLPRPNPFNDELVISAYNRCLDLEEREAQVIKHGRLPPLISARLLGYLIVEATTKDGRLEICTDIIGAVGDQALQALANVYKDHFIRCFHSARSRSPTPSHHPSAPSFDAQKQPYRPLLVPTPRSHQTAKAKVSLIDGPSARAGLVDDVRGASPYTVTHAAHIFDRSTNEDLGVPKKADYAASFNAVLDRFGQIKPIAELNGANIHRLENILTLSLEFHSLFDKLEIWLERNPNDPPHQYTIASTDPGYTQSLQNPVTLITHDAETHPLPDHRYLALHAACARVAHLSGASEYIMQVLRELEHIGVLAYDGSSDALYYALVRRLNIEAH
ncbi:hypothetical protein D9615_000667 [Tricholomella constricta]|uniref:HNH nuclease domain-containing protein n=1 Tax=Tricholomella constricta TaxID=117010 RepID=A0A8H5MB35_9AGAR|nr:hypothetical protein D9615_000667 [Tricholomella constricta]